MEDIEDETGLPRASELEPEKKKNAYPIIRYTDVPEESKADIVDTITDAIERFGSNYDVAAKAIKEDLDKNYGSHWHVVIGEAYGFEVSHHSQHIMYMFFMGNLATLVWKNN